LRNCYLSASTARAIDRQVAKVLRGLNNPEPPLRVEEVIELLKLDRQFYTSTEDGVFRETFSRIKVGVIQVFQRPTLLKEAIEKLNLRALYLPDRKRILIDSELPDAKVRWASAHEITHDLCVEWHEHVLFGDSETTISETCHQQIEHEANYGAGRLLTLQDRFKEEICGHPLTLKEIGAIAKSYGNTWTSTLWRVVESLDIPAFAVVGAHPRHTTDQEQARYFIRSRSFEAEFPDFGEEDALSLMRHYCSYSRRGPLGSDELTIRNGRGEEVSFQMESFATVYDVLTLAQRVRKKPSIISLPPTAQS
jgi:Zn-dependent peptidase ImmA (M78 family)